MQLELHLLKLILIFVPTEKYILQDFFLQLGNET